MRTRIALTIVLSLLVLASLPAAAFGDSGGVHVVRTGETLNSIAAAHGVSAAALARANGITNPDRIWVGQRLVIPGGSSSSGGSTSPGSSGSTSSPAKPSSRTYVVRSGDTLGSIAARLGVSAASLAAVNGITNPDRIYPGMVLRVPGASSGGSSGGPTGPASPKAGGTRFVADISSQHCWLYVSGNLVGSWRCSTGRRAAPTMAGNFRVQSKIRNAWASTWSFWMPYWLGIYWAGSTENGIHGLPYNGPRKTWAGMVGVPITFGCVMLDDVNAKKLWDVAYIGMPVIITR